MICHSPWFFSAHMCVSSSTTHIVEIKCTRWPSRSLQVLTSYDIIFQLKFSYNIRYGSIQLLLSLTFKTSDSHWLKETHHKCIFKVSTKDTLLSPTFVLIMKIKFHFTSGDFGQSYFSFIQEVAIKKKTKAILCCQFLWLKFRYITYTCEVDKVILKEFPLTESHFWVSFSSEVSIKRCHC